MEQYNLPYSRLPDTIIPNTIAHGDFNNLGRRMGPGADPYWADSSGYLTYEIKGTTNVLAIYWKVPLDQGSYSSFFQSLIVDPSSKPGGGLAQSLVDQLSENAHEMVLGKSGSSSFKTEFQRTVSGMASLNRQWRLDRLGDERPRNPDVAQAQITITLDAHIL
jgi:hypothetical protein